MSLVLLLFLARESATKIVQKYMKNYENILQPGKNMASWKMTSH